MSAIKKRNLHISQIREFSNAGIKESCINLWHLKPFSRCTVCILVITFAKICWGSLPTKFSSDLTKSFFFFSEGKPTVVWFSVELLKTNLNKVVYFSSRVWIYLSWSCLPMFGPLLWHLTMKMVNGIEIGEKKTITSHNHIIITRCLWLSNTILQNNICSQILGKISIMP